MVGSFPERTVWETVPASVSSGSWPYIMSRMVVGRGIFDEYGL
jgi:hypothetical protein